MDYYGQQETKLRKVRLVRNGTTEKLLNITLKHNILYSELCVQINEIMGFSNNLNDELRIFRNGGVELDKEEVGYIRDHEILYISKGEDFDEGSHFSEYKLISELGQGGFGIVHEARHRITKEKVAIKIAENNKAQSAKDVEMMFKEISALKNLKHKNILKILNAFTLKKEMKVVLVLEFLEGGELKKYVKENGRLCEEECQYFFKQLYHAISYCHREKIIHRDLKLENIMLTDRTSKQIKVVDFGISGMSNNFNLDYTEAGSVRYLAPEVIQYKAPANSAIDIWAMGIILYWMLHGYPPFDGPTKQIIIEKILKGQYEIDHEIKSQCSSAIIDLISQTLKQDPRERISIFNMGNHNWIIKPVDQIIKEEQDQADELKKLQQINLSLSSSEKNEEEKCNHQKEKLMKQRKSFAAPTQSFLNRFNIGSDKQDFNSDKSKQKKHINTDKDFTPKNPKQEISEFSIQQKQVTKDQK